MQGKSRMDRELLDAGEMAGHLVPPGFFFADYGTGQAGLLQKEVELLALVRSASISPAQLRPILELSPAARQAIIDFIVAVTAAR